MHETRGPHQSNALARLQGGGEMGACMRAKDWSTTHVGPVERPTLGVTHPHAPKAPGIDGAQLHVAKPVDPEELVATIASFLGRTGAVQ